MHRTENTHPGALKAEPGALSGAEHGSCSRPGDGSQRSPLSPHSCPPSSEPTANTTVFPSC